MKFKIKDIIVKKRTLNGGSPELYVVKEQRHMSFSKLNLVCSSINRDGPRDIHITQRSQKRWVKVNSDPKIIELVAEFLI